MKKIRRMLLLWDNLELLEECNRIDTDPNSNDSQEKLQDLTREEFLGVGDCATIYRMLVAKDAKKDFKHLREKLARD